MNGQPSNNNNHVRNREYTSFRNAYEKIYELQTYLRYISKYIKGIPKINPDGIYGPETTNAVRAFQQRFGLPITGETDFETWTQIVLTYDDLIRQSNLPHYIAAYPIEIPRLKEGDKFEEIYMLQIMLRRLAKLFKNIIMPDLTGVYDKKTAAAVRDFAELYGKDTADGVDRELWNVLTDTYNAFTHNS